MISSHRKYDILIDIDVAFIPATVKPVCNDHLYDKIYCL